MAKLYTDIENIKTKDEIDTLIKQYYKFLSKPFYILACKTEGSRYDVEEVDQLLRIIMIYHTFRGFRLDTVVDFALEECGGIWVDRSDSSLYHKMISLKKQFRKELLVMKAIKPAFYCNISRLIKRRSKTEEKYNIILQNLRKVK